MEAKHRSRSPFPLSIVLLAALTGGCLDDIGKLFRIEVQGPETVEAGSPFDVKVSVICARGTDISLEWIDPQAQSVLSAPFIADGVVVPSIEVSSSLTCEPDAPSSMTIHFQSLDDARLGEHHLDLRASREFAAINWVVVAPTNPGFELQIPRQALVDAGTTMDVDVGIVRNAENGSVMLAAEGVLAPGVLVGFVPDLTFDPNPIFPGETTSRLTVSGDLSSLRQGQAVGVVVRAMAGATARAALVRFLRSTEPPATPLLSASPRTNSVVLAWNTDPIVGSYRLERADAGGPFQVLAPSLAGTVTSYEDSGLAPQTAYEYRLTAINVNGESAPATVTVTTLALPTTATLTVIVSGNGTVTSMPSGISCPGDCSEPFPLTPVTDVTLSANPAGGATFGGWSGSCTGGALTAVVHMDTDKSCTASFVTPTTGWTTVLASLASSADFHLDSSTMLDGSGQAFIAYVQHVGVQFLITVSREGNGAFPRYGGALNATSSWSALQPALALDPGGQPIVAFVVYGIAESQIAVARWDDTGKQWQFLTLRANLTNTDGYDPQVAVVGNTLVVAWIEQQQVVVARHDLTSTQWDAGAGAFVPTLSGVNGIDLALDGSGQAVIAYTVGFTNPVLRAVREDGAGGWTSLGGDLNGPLPPADQRIDYFRVHVDAADTVRVVWSEGVHPFVLRAGSFDGTTWQPVFGSSLTLLEGATRFRDLAVNRTGRLFAFAAAYDVACCTQSTISVYRPQGTVETIIGGSTLHPQVGSLSMAMLDQDQPTVVHSQYDTTGSPPQPYTLPIRRYHP